MKTHIKSSDVPTQPMAPGILRKIIGYDSDLMLVKVNFKKGAVADVHNHPHQQVGYIVEGKFELEIDGKKEILEAGDAFVAPSKVMHGAVCLEAGTIIDTFSPKRDDFLE